MSDCCFRSRISTFHIPRIHTILLLPDHDRGFGSGCVSEQEEEITELDKSLPLNTVISDVVSKVLQLNNRNAFLPAVQADGSEHRWTPVETRRPMD